MSNKTSVLRDVILGIFDIVVTLISVFKKRSADKSPDDSNNNTDGSDNGHRVTRY